MKRFAIITVSAISIIPGTALLADDKPKFNLSRFNPLARLMKKDEKKDEPVSKTKQLTELLRTDPDEKKRKAAAEELRNVEQNQVAEVLLVLVASLKQDPSPSVRSVAAESIGKMQPVALSAGVVLETATANDPSEAVRKSAQNALVNYQQNGYRLSTTALSQSTEPPAAKNKTASQATLTTRQLTPPSNTLSPIAKQPQAVPSGINRGPSYKETTEPPLAVLKPVAIQPVKPAAEVPPIAPARPLPLPAEPKTPAMPIPPKVPLPLTAQPSAKPNSTVPIPIPKNTPTSEDPGF